MPVARERLALEAPTLAPRLLGAVLTSRVGGVEVAVRLTEVEAYAGSRDPASHAYLGPTPRTRVMFGPAGHLYCYFTYGRHWCANVVCGPEGEAAAVLLRAGEVIGGAEFAAARRPAARTSTELARGPARLASCLGLDSATIGVDLCDPLSPVTLDGVASRRPPGVVVGPRIGITVGTARAWRFWLPDEPSVSRFRPGARRPGTAGRQT